MPSKKVFIIVLNWNGWKNTIACLKSLYQLSYSNYRVVIIDNGSNNDSIKAIKNWGYLESISLIEYNRYLAEKGGIKETEKAILANSCQHLILIRIDNNLGYAGGNNVGIHYALKNYADYVWLLNNDTIVDINSLTEMINLAEMHDDVGLIGAKLYYYDRPNVFQAVGGSKFNFWQGLSHQYGWLQEDHGQWDNIFKPDHLVGASMLLKSKVVKTAGLMNESFFLYGEELEWQIRIKRYGWLFLYCPSAKVWHKENSSLGYKSPVIEFYYTRNCLWIIRKYSLWTLPTALIFHFLRILRRLIRGDFGQALAVLKGIYAGTFNKLPDFGSINV